jgi:hypothetical protein
MYRLLEKSGQPKEQQDPARATANEADPQKGKPAGRTCSRHGGYNHRPQPIGRPVTSAGKRNATPFGVAFRASGPILGCGSKTAREAWRKRHLPAGTLLCSIRLAYQAADASHPRRAERARRRARKFRRTVESFSSDTRGGNSHRKGITRGKHLPHRIDTETLGERLRSFCVGAGKAAVGPFFRGSWQIARS